MADTPVEEFAPRERLRLLRLELTNFLSYREARLDFGDMVALVGPNASGKSNAVAALKLLRDIPTYGLQTALLRRGGFDQLRHRSESRPYNPSLAVDFSLGDDLADSRYELHLASVAGGLYAVKLERAEVNTYEGKFTFVHRRGRLEVEAKPASEEVWLPDMSDRFTKVPEGQSALGVIVSFWPFYWVWQLCNGMQVVESNPARVRELQDPTPGVTFEPDGSNTTSIFESLEADERRRVVDEVKAIVPSLDNIEVRRFSNKMTLNFFQLAGERRRTFLANQMSDGTLRAFSIILALYQPRRPVFLVVEEPETAIHLGALRTLVEILEAHAEDAQILLTTHSADIIDALSISDLRVVWAEDGVSHVAVVAEHTRETVRRGLITPGELLRADSLDPRLE